MSPKSGGIDRAVGWRHFVYGGAASCIAEIGTFPLDTTKTRLQIQGQQSKHLMSGGVSPIRKLYSGMLDALIRIPKEEGIKALYRGISPALLRQSIYGTLKFGNYYSLKKVIPQENVASNIICAVFAGMVSSAIANPTDVLKVRMQVATSSTSGSSLFSSFHKIYKYEGLGGLWRGVGPTSQRAGIIAAVELPVYDGCKKYFIDMNIFDDSPPNHIVSSFIASFTAVIASTPIDVIRTRLMSQKLQQHSTPVGNPPGVASSILATTVENTKPSTNLANIETAVAFNGSDPRHGSLSSNALKSNIYKSSWDCFRITLKHEGIRALYKGFIPAWLRMGPWNLIFFTSYEQLLRLY